MGVTYLIAELVCPRCGKVSPADSSTRMTCRLADGAGVQLLGVGDLVTTPSVAAEYIGVRTPDAEVRILEVWWCCAMNWAVVTVANGKITRIQAHPIHRATLDDVHFVTENIDELFTRLTGLSLWDDRGIRSDFVDRLRDQLPD
jgi:hypothetical protein